MALRVEILYLPNIRLSS